MKKFNKILSVLLFGYSVFGSTAALAAEKAKTQPVANDAKTTAEPTTRNDAVIFKIHDINPVSEEGIVTGCDFTVTLYNRTAINFRSFTINLEWQDSVDERFKFERYIESFIGSDDFVKQQDFIGKEVVDKPLQTAITVNAFGVDKQISVRSHVDNDKCYLMLSTAVYSVSPCDIARSVETSAGSGFDNKDCSHLFQFVDTSNPEYFGQFKKISATDVAAQNVISENRELSDIDAVINKIVENLGTSDKTLTNIN